MRPVRTGHSAAFAEGRRLREESRRQRQAAAGRTWTASPWLMLLVIPVASVGVAVLAGVSLLLAVLGVLAVVHAFPAVVLVGVVYAGVRRRRHRDALRRGGAAGTAPLPARPAAPPRPDLVWARARERFHALRAEYAAFECDPMAVLGRPALADVTVGSTERFVDAFAEAQALETDRFPGQEHAAAFVAAGDRAERAWRAACDAADRIRLSGLSPAERATVEKVIKLLTTARDSDSDPERLAAYSRARAELVRLDRTGVIQVPLPARAALDEASRGALPA